MSSQVGRSAPRAVLPVLLLAFAALALLAWGCVEGEGTQTAGETTTTSLLVVPIKDDQCLACHQEDLEQAMAAEQQRIFSHELHLAQRINCRDCHSDIGHDGVPIYHPQTCEDCHGLTMPHPAGYERDHGREVLDMGGSEVCERCHNVYLHCQECHGLQMPHPAQWELKHGELAYPRMQSCRDCHEDQYCLQCHPVVMPHPEDWTKTHGIPVVEQGSEMCATCHEPELCTSCHGMAMPHPADWGTSHPDVAAEKRGECLLCHDEADCASCHEIHETHGKGGAA